MNTSSDSLQKLPVDSLREAWGISYGILAACTFLTYDVILTLGHEITHIWSAKWSFPKAVYFIVRYYGVAHLLVMAIISLSLTISLESCRRFFVMTIFGGPIVFSTLANLIIILRLHALYNRDHKVLLFLILLVAFQFTTELYSAVKIHLGMVVDVVRPLGLPWPGCIVSRYSSRDVIVSVIPSLITSTVMFLLTLRNLIKSVSHIQGWRNVSKPSEYGAWRFPPLLSAFARDGTVHYFMILFVTITAEILTMPSPGPLNAFLGPGQLTILSFSTSRLILNLRVSAAHLQGSTATWQQTFSIRITDSIAFHNESLEESVEQSTELCSL